MHPRTVELRHLMEIHDLGVDEVAAMVGRSPQTVLTWRCKTGGRVIPAHTLEFLKLKIAQHLSRTTH